MTRARVEWQNRRNERRLPLTIVVVSALLAVVLATLPFSGPSDDFVAPGSRLRKKDLSSRNTIVLRITNSSGHTLHMLYGARGSGHETGQPSVSWSREQFDRVVVSKDADGVWTVEATLRDSQLSKGMSLPKVRTGNIPATEIRNWQIGIFFEL
jgi:hypothetical protein